MAQSLLSRVTSLPNGQKCKTEESGKSSRRPRPASFSFQRQESNLASLFTGDPVDRDKPIKAKSGEVLAFACRHERLCMPEMVSDTVVENLPTLDDMTAYNVSAVQQHHLWKKEIERLVDAVNHPQTVIQFAGTESLATDTKKAYKNLSFLAEKMWLCYRICTLDNESLLKEHISVLHDSEELQETIVDLERWVEGADNKPKLALSSKGSREDFFELVNYVTVVLARFLCRSAYGPEWHRTVLAALAKTSAKLKVLSCKPEEYAASSLASSTTTSLEECLDAVVPQNTRQQANSLVQPMEQLRTALSQLEAGFPSSGSGVDSRHARTPSDASSGAKTPWFTGRCSSCSAMSFSRCAARIGCARRSARRMNCVREFIRSGSRNSRRSCTRIAILTSSCHRICTW
ncbi:hypothetical protein VTN96DRAFT_3079 [Rasamsonia emersonii]